MVRFIYSSVKGEMNGKTGNMAVAEMEKEWEQIQTKILPWKAGRK